jgi:hypothetical protein
MYKCLILEKIMTCQCQVSFAASNEMDGHGFSLAHMLHLFSSDSRSQFCPGIGGYVVGPETWDAD